MGQQNMINDKNQEIEELKNDKEGLEKERN